MKSIALKLFKIVLIILFLVSCRTVDFQLQNDGYKVLRNDQDWMLFYSVEKFDEQTQYDHKFKVAQFIFFDDGTYFVIEPKFEKNIDTVKTIYINYKGIYDRVFSHYRWGIYNQMAGDYIIAESMNNVRYLEDGYNPIKGLPYFDTKYVEKFKFLTDSTLVRYERDENKAWVVRDTLFQVHNPQVDEIDPSKAWIYDKMLDYPYWENQKNK